MAPATTPVELARAVLQALEPADSLPSAPGEVSPAQGPTQGAPSERFPPPRARTGASKDWRPTRRGYDGPWPLLRPDARFPPMNVLVVHGPNLNLLGEAKADALSYAELNLRLETFAR